jgi:predicted nucleic acid-binding protein
VLIKRAIINASPLIVLFKSQQVELLPQLFEEILVPDAVWEEVTAAGQEDAASQQLPIKTWAQKTEVGLILPQVTTWDLVDTPTFALRKKGGILGSAT